MTEKLYYQSDKTALRIDWDVIMPLDRYAGGHDEQMECLLKNVTVIAHHNDDDYQGNVATCVQLNETKEIVIYNDSYGSCSGCDAWENATDDEVRTMCNQLACGAYVFKSLTDCVYFLATVDKEKDFEWGYNGLGMKLLNLIPEDLISADARYQQDVNDPSTREDLVII
jgi:hypothetical protein